MRERSESMSWKVLFMVLLLCTTMMGIIINVTSGLPQPTIYVDPPTTTVVLGKSFTINMSIVNVTYPESGKGIYGWECDMSFNASILQVVNIEEGPFLKQAGDTMWATPVIDNTAGTIITADQLEPTWPTWGAFSYLGVVMLANVTFQTKAEGESHLNFTYTKLNTYTGTYPPPPVDHTVVNGSATITPGHDAAVVSVTAPVEAASGYSVPVNVTVKNEGSYTEDVNVTLKYDSTYIDSKNVTLDKKESTTVSFTWSTTGVSKGNCTLNATATIDVEDDPTDNSKTTTIRIVEHDVAVIDLEAPPGAKPGWTVSINVKVANQGSNQETALNVTVSYDGNLIGFNDTVVLDPQTNTTVPFSWNTASLPIGDYTLNATATIPVEDDPTDNSKNKTITLYLIHDVAVISLEAEYDPEEPYSPVGKPIPINVTVRNEGDYPEDVNVTLKYDSTYIDSKNFTLTPGQSKNASFTWDTTGLTPRTYPVKATVSPNNTDTWTGDGEEKSFYTTRKPVDLGSEKVYVNQTLKIKPADYTIDYETGNITFTTAPGEGADVKAIYFAREDDYPVNNYKTKDIILTVHDVAVVSITAPSWASSGSKVPIDVTVKDEGSWRETINLTLKYDDTFIENKTFDVYKGQSTTVSFTWNTLGIMPGYYTLTATATVLPSPSNSGGIDDDPTDNTLVDGTIFITITGDANGDRKVDKSDLSELNAAYGSAPGDANWNERCDFNGDNKVDALDLFDLGKNYGKSI